MNQYGFSTAFQDTGSGFIDNPIILILIVVAVVWLWRRS